MATRWWPFVALQLLLPLIKGQAIPQPSSVSLSDYRHNAARLLTDLVRHDAVPTNLFLLACWTPSENVGLAKTFRGPVTILRHSGGESLALPVDLNVNRVAFVVDLNCEWPNGWLNQVRIFIYFLKLFESNRRNFR